MFSKTISIIVILAFGMPVWAQYQNDDEVININDSEIIVSAEDFYRHLDGAAASNGTGNELDLSSFDKVLDFSKDIVKARAIVGEAITRGYPDEETANGIRRMINNQLREAATVQIEDMIEVPDEVIEDFYSHMDTNLKVAIIIIEDGDTSREIYDKLLSGADFGDLAAENNIDDQLKENRGELPQPINYHFDPTVKAAFELEELGDFTEPMELPTGNWIIVKLNERIAAYTDDNPKPGLEEVRESIISQYIQFESMDFTRETLDNDLTNVEVWRDEDLYEKGLTWHRDKIIEKIYGNRSVLARIGDTELYFEDWWPKSEFENTSDEDWEKRRNNPDGDEVVKYLENRYKDKLDDIRLVAWAKLKGLEKDPAIAWDIWRKTSEMTLDNFTEMELLPLLPYPSDEEVRAYFDEHADEYFEKESLSGRLYSFPTEEEANHYYEISGDYIPENNIARDILMAKIAEDYGLISEEGNPTPKIEEYYITYRASREPEIERKFDPEVSDELADSILSIAYEVESHVYSPVYTLSNGRYAFFWNRYYKPFRTKEFDEVEDKIYRKLNDELAGSEKTTAIVEKWITDITSKYDYVINEDTARAVYEKWQADNPVE